jgi:hypothetical protein
MPLLFGQSACLPILMLYLLGNELTTHFSPTKLSLYNYAPDDCKTNRPQANFIFNYSRYSTVRSHC